MSLHQREHTTIRTESAGIANARHSLDNVLSAKSNLEQTSSWQVEDPVDIGCALDLQIGELEGMLAEIMDERFARMMDESQQDDENENRNTGLLNFIIDTADNILASLLSTHDAPPPTYEKHRINIQSNSPTQLSSAHKPKFESSDVSFPLPTESRAESHSPGAIISKNRNDQQSSTNTLPPPIPSVPTKSTHNKLVGLGSSNPTSSSPNPFRGRGFMKSQDDSSTTIDDLSFSAFHALQDSEAFKTLLNRSENKITSDVDRDNLWFSFREAFGNNLSKELLCAFDILIKVSSNSERSAKEVDKSGLGDIDHEKGKTPLRSESPPPTSRSPSPFTDSDFVTIESPDNTQSQQKTTQSHNFTTSLQPPPYAQHQHQTYTKSEPPSSSSSQCIICGISLTVTHPRDLTNSILKAPCGHTFCSICAEWLLEAYIRDESFHRVRCRCNECIPKIDIERFIAGYRNEEQRECTLMLFREKYDRYDVTRVRCPGGWLDK